MPINNVPLINGVAYTHVQVECFIGGVQIKSLTKIDFGQTQEKKNNHGTGNNPVSRGRGPIDSSGSLSFAMNEVEAVREGAPNRSLLLIDPFDVTIVFLNAQRPVTKVLKSCEFTEDKTSSETGNMDTVLDLPIIIGDIKN